MSGVDRIHFLIHPGFLTDSSDGELLNEMCSEEADLILHERYAFVVERYLRSLEMLEKNEIIFLFAHTNADDFRRHLDQQKYYAKKIVEMQKMLGGKILTVFADFDIFNSGNDAAYLEAELLARKKGHHFDRSIDTVAYGETLGCCVEEGAHALNTAANLTKKTVIKPHLSSLGAPGGLQIVELPAHVKRMKERFDRIDFDLS